MREGIIYLITNKVNGKKYVGQTVNTLKYRWRNGHLKSAAKGSPFAIHKAIRKHGADNFTIEIIAESLQPFLNDLEVFFVLLYGSHTSQHGYNMTEGGDGRGELHPLSGKPKSAEHKKKLSEIKKGHKLSDEHKAALSRVGKGRKHTTETRQRMSLAQQGRECSPEEKERLQLIGKQQAEKNLGIPLSAERKARISASLKGNVVPFDRRLKISESLRGNTNHLGKPHSSGARQKLREAWARRKQRTAELKLAA